MNRKGAMYLTCAILFEVCGSTMLKYSEGFTILWPSIGVVIGFLTSFTCLGLALKSMSLSTAYAIWSGVGTALTACIGILLFEEQINALKITALLFIIVGVAILNKSNSEQVKTVES
ncbi:MAG: multidrug efflux SMR transporter [Candidatus Pristimantibacillus lignocellulolyticus]|uniref:Multidrug efflux SMR transporter n=1 Tax=Candidatus Pristimantibacillus lignocellulolyticus TaxID=2994561 RepID=A0A9J6ZI73_9BACL|nr:MAG: multidrug efflux SMR transporter [Candidatus Pristimantibacillus lignocellulolyticus]